MDITHQMVKSCCYVYKYHISYTILRIIYLLLFVHSFVVGFSLFGLDFRAAVQKRAKKKLSIVSDV